MTAELYIRLIAETIVAFGLIYLVQRPLRKVKHRFVLGIIFVLKAVAAVYLGLVLIALDYKIVWNHPYPFGALYLAMMGDLAKDVVCFIISLFRGKRSGETLKFVTALVLTAAFAAFNILNMQAIRANYHQIESEKLTHPYKLVFLADLHYGSAQSRETVDKALEEIAALKPDYLLLGGDITDEYTTKEEMEYIYRKIGSLGLETYYVYGNHDRQDRGELMLGATQYTETELKDAIEGNGIRILCEDFVEINEDLILLGREDPTHPGQRTAVKDLPDVPEGCYVICIDHTPYQNEEIEELGADLQISGHTHAAQFFPEMTVYKLLGLNVYGDYTIGDTHLVVSPGISGWALPLRSEGPSADEVFELR